MRIEWLEKAGGDTAVVVPVDTPERDCVRNLLLEVSRMKWSMVVVVDSYPTFNFSRSMNAGIAECLRDDGIKHIALSNDDVYDISLPGAIEYLDENDSTFVSPCVNGKSGELGHFSDLVRESIHNRAPLWFWKHLRHMHAMRSIAGGCFANTQPFALFRADTLRTYNFDEGFDMGVEDFELGMRLHRDGIVGVIRTDWNVKHGGHETIDRMIAAKAVATDKDRYERNWEHFHAIYGK